MHARKSALPLIVFLAGCIGVAQPAFAAGDPPPPQAQRRPTTSSANGSPSRSISRRTFTAPSKRSACPPIPSCADWVNPAATACWSRCARTCSAHRSRWGSAPPPSQSRDRRDGRSARSGARQGAGIDVDTMAAYPINRSGLSYGALMVPFKYHVTGSRRFQGSGSVGPYAGYKMESSKLGASLEILGFLGLSSVQVEPGLAKASRSRKTCRRSATASARSGASARISRSAWCSAPIG